MHDWVRVLDKDDNVIFMNSAMSKSLAQLTAGDKCYNVSLGMKCYNAIGRTERCENCISRQSVFDGEIHEKEEKIGDRFFSVMSSPIRERNGEIIAVVEVLRDITQTKQLQKEIMRRNQKYQNELEIARKIQMSMLPKKIHIAGIDFSFLYKPCEALAGDFLDIFKIDRDHVGVYIADVSGHGIPASMITIFLRSKLNKKVLSPAEALKSLFNEFNSEDLDENIYITIFYSIIDLEKKVMTYCNAGHCVSPVLFNENKFEILEQPGVPICRWVKEPGYTDVCVKLEEGDSIFYCTDGIIELRNSMKVQFGEERLFSLLEKYKGTPSDMLNIILEEAKEFSGLSDLRENTDDITLAILKIKNKDKDKGKD